MTQFKRKQETEIDPEDIWGNDAFGTLESYATFLTNALVADGGNFVLNVNGAWGSGKSFFVNRWAEQLRQAGHPVVEFNAWENDSVEDPLAPMIASLIDSQKEILPPTVGNKLKQGCGKYIMAGGGFIVRAGLKQLVGEKGIDSVNEMLSIGTENELIKLAGQHVEEQLEKQKAARGIAEQLEAFVVAIEAHADLKLPIFIFIDELDRCRPTFAIELLERVKHLFHVDGIKFVITTDSRQLAHSICGAYGSGFDGTTYLRRFFDETFTLPEPSSEQFSECLWSAFSDIQRAKHEWVYETTPAATFSNLASVFGLTLRDQVQAVHRIEAAINNIQYSSEAKLHFIYLCALVMLRMQRSEDYFSLTSEIRVGTGFPSSAFKRWSDIGDGLVIQGIYNEILGDYFELARGNHDAAIKLCNSAQARVEDPRSQSATSWLKHDLYRSAVMDFKTFKLYPQLVELTSQLT